MSLYVCNVGSVGGSQKGARASAASWCRYVEREAEYGNKDGRITSFVELPKGAPEEWKDPHVLWRAVAEHEGPGARTGREFMVGFQNELTREQNIECTREFALRLTAVGLPVHVAIHRAPSGSEHGHITSADRQLNADGTWADSKRTVTYPVRRDGEQITINSELWKTAKSQGWEKIYPFKDGVDRTKSECEAAGLSWKEDRVRDAKGNSYPLRGERSDTPATASQLVAWKKVWAEVVNEALERYAPEAERVSHLSYADRGIEKVPGVHLGALANRSEQEGFPTVKGEKNRAIEQINEQLGNRELPRELRQSILEQGYDLRSRHFENAEHVRRHTRSLLEPARQIVRHAAEHVRRVADVVMELPVVRTVRSFMREMSRRNVDVQRSGYDLSYSYQGLTFGSAEIGPRYSLEAVALRLSQRISQIYAIDAQRKVRDEREYTSRLLVREQRDDPPSRGSLARDPIEEAWAAYRSQRESRKSRDSRVEDPMRMNIKQMGEYYSDPDIRSGFGRGRWKDRGDDAR